MILFFGGNCTRLAVALELLLFFFLLEIRYFCVTAYVLFFVFCFLFHCAYFVEINCGPLGVLHNGWMENSQSGTGLGASVIFRCDEGMMMVGNTSTICQIDGTWTYPPPLCLGNSVHSVYVSGFICR